MSKERTLTASERTANSVVQQLSSILPSEPWGKVLLGSVIKLDGPSRYYKEGILHVCRERTVEFVWDGYLTLKIVLQQMIGESMADQNPQDETGPSSKWDPVQISLTGKPAPRFKTIRDADITTVDFDGHDAVQVLFNMASGVPAFFHRLEEQTVSRYMRDSKTR